MQVVDDYLAGQRFDPSVLKAGADFTAAAARLKPGW
jgi:hypothetical protein